MNMAMHANLTALAYQLDDARRLVASARDAMERKNRNLAVGAVLPLELILPQCDTLLRSVLALQCWRNQLPEQQGDAALVAFALGLSRSKSRMGMVSPRRFASRLVPTVRSARICAPSKEVPNEQVK